MTLKEEVKLLREKVELLQKYIEMKERLAQSPISPCPKDWQQKHDVSTKPWERYMTYC
jgi:hypothetical protein